MRLKDVAYYSLLVEFLLCRPVILFNFGLSFCNGFAPLPIYAFAEDN